MPRTELLHLRPNGTYVQTRAFYKPEWPTLVMTAVNRVKQAFHLDQNPIFTKSTPTVAESWEDFTFLENPDPALRDRRGLMVVEANNPFPLSSLPPMTPEAKVRLGTSRYEEMQGQAQERASRQQHNNATARLIAVVLTLGFGILVLIFGIIVVNRVWGSGQEVTEGLIPALPMLRRPTFRFRFSLRGFAKSRPLLIPGLLMAFALFMLSRLMPGGPWVVSEPYEPVSRAFLVLALAAAGVAVIPGPRFQLVRDAWGKLNDRLRRAYEVWQKYETAIVLDTTAIYRVKLPPDVLAEHLPRACRWTPDTYQPYVFGALGGFGFIGGLTYLLFLPALLPVGALIVAFGVGLPFGALPGLFMGPLFGPKPIWVVRRHRERTKDEDGKPAIKVTIDPVIHSLTTDVEYILEKVKDREGNETEMAMPRIYRADMQYQATEVRDERHMYQSHQTDNWEKFEVGLIVFAVLGIGTLLFLFVTANSGG